MKFVHAADLHLDSPLCGLSRYDGAPIEQIRLASRRALENLVDLCVEEEARLLVIAGDVFDGDWRDYATGLFFSSQMARLHEAGVRVVWIRGNHDAASRLTKHVELPNVHELPCDRPGTVVCDELGIAIHGQGFATAALTRDLTHAYPEPIAGLFNIGLLHTALEGAEGHMPYAPCKPEALIQKGYDYWALGHVHGFEVRHRSPWIVYPGNLQGRHVRECGPKGAVLVTIEDGEVSAVEHRALDVVRFHVCQVDATGATSPDDVVERAVRELELAAEESDGLLVAARVLVSGATASHRVLAADPAHWVHQLQSAAMYLKSTTVWIEKVAFATRGELDVARLRQREDAIGELARALGALRSAPEELAPLLDDLTELRHKLPADIARTSDALAFDTPAAAERLIAEVEQLLLPRLLAGEEP